MFDIQIDVPYTGTNFFRDLFEKARTFNVDVTFSKDRHVYFLPNQQGSCNGFFTVDGDRPIFSVACGQPFDQWFPIVVHESCHMDQWIEKVPAWTDTFIGGVEATAILELWTNFHIEMTDDQLWKVIDICRELERDCEERVIEKALRYNLPMDIEEHAKKGNAYVYFYNIMGFSRKWYEIGKEPYNVPEVWQNMPTNFRGEYAKTPLDIFDLYRLHVEPLLAAVPQHHPRISR